MDWRPPLSFIRQLSGQIPRNSSHSIGRGSAGARCAGSVVIGSAVHVPFILARHKDKSPALRPILADTFGETQAISRIAINRPLSDGRAEKPHVFRHTVPRVENSSVIPDSCPVRRRMENLYSDRGINPTFFGTQLRLLNGRGGGHSSTNLSAQNGQHFGKGDNRRVRRAVVVFERDRERTLNALLELGQPGSARYLRDMLEINGNRMRQIVLSLLRDGAIVRSDYRNGLRLEVGYTLSEPLKTWMNPDTPTTDAPVPPIDQNLSGGSGHFDSQGS
jgi:hypothetical protein